ncbi:P-loop containing nucleoside triphosphate hydrolase protein [Dioszegia hungarica]|uniref:P-loop containing nucleoside triphosphate hydrolase protein n=1 Tax=Dioszegia hungarica TaxID=4972 RepID=A0AA38LU15_9TREE|nr:P-loop containing nucleoside triphosphate hydrolase protein [Dioszegia hungarica]KAI9635173.1 P-loop containing nucleoside triphosphate hydrolase protein [Dioszegia hungarica]
MSSLLSVKGLTLRRGDGSGSAIINDLSLDVKEGEVIVVRGASGSGKTTLLKCIPSYRTRVQYVPQRPSLLPGTPLELVSLLQSFSARRSTSKGTLEDAMRIAGDWGVEKTLWMRPWATLSGGEGQRVALAIALAAGGAEVLLLDEPTSALDEPTTIKVEKTLLAMLRVSLSSQRS